MKLFSLSIVTALCSVLMFGCAQFAAVQNNPAVQAAENAGITIALSLATRSPAFAFVAPLAVSGLTALANSSSKTAVTGSLINDVPLITQTIAAAIPNSSGKTAATQIANAYANAMSASGMAPTTDTANQVIAALAKGLNAGAVAATPN